MIRNLFLLSLLFLFSCEDNENNIMNIEANVFLKVNDAQGNDLLDPNQGSIDPTIIKVFYVKQNGEILEVNNPNLDSPKGYILITPDMDNSSFYKIQFFLNIEYLNSDTISYTKVEWSPGDTDEIKAQFLKQNNSIIVSKIWINNQLKWTSKDEKVITIIK